MIHATQLRFSYPGGTSLVFADADVTQGSVLLLSGPSGCGKSTWLALVGGPRFLHLSAAAYRIQKRHTNGRLRAANLQLSRRFGN
jgi:ABC-type Fe3+/spermidine/putrescine transport system ATPase subunit